MHSPLRLREEPYSTVFPATQSSTINIIFFKKGI
jgi:hypothetical protein